MSFVFDAVPLWLLFFATVGTILLAIEFGFRTGRHRARRSEHEREAPIDAMVGSTLGLLAFVLAFTFGMAASRFDARGELLIDEAIAIRTADLRAQLLQEPQRSEIRTLLRQYVDVRLSVRTASELPGAIVRSENLQQQLWSRAATLEPDSALTQAFIEMIDLHSKRMAVAVRNRIPRTIWIALYCLTIFAMAITGYRTGIAERRSVVATVTVALAFSVVIAITVDLDRPRGGFLHVNQQAMLELQTRLHRP